MGKCPKCNAALNSVKIESTDGHEATLESILRCFHYLRPFCNYILSVSFDPESLKEAMVEEILSTIGTRL